MPWLLPCHLSEYVVLAQTDRKTWIEYRALNPVPVCLTFEPWLPQEALLHTCTVLGDAGKAAHRKYKRAQLVCVPMFPPIVFVYCHALAVYCQCQAL